MTDRNLQNLVFIGMRASGKSHIGSIVARDFRLKFFDLDKVVEHNIKMSIEQLVERYGWEKFRAIEAKACARVAEKSGIAVATGGGAVIDPRNVENLRSTSFIVLLRAPIADLARRLETSSHNQHRPSLTGKSITEELEGIWQERREAYESAADLVFDCPTISGDKKADVEVHARNLIALLRKTEWQTGQFLTAKKTV